MSDIASRLWGRVVKTPAGCWEFQGARATINRYGRISYNGKVDGAHRVAYELAKGPIPDGHLVMHSCDNPPCVNPDHLSVGTTRDNMHDMKRKGRARAFRGDENPMTRLTDAQVAELRELYARRVPVKTLAERFGISEKYVAHLGLGIARPPEDSEALAELLAQRKSICSKGHPRTPENTREVQMKQHGHIRTVRICIPCRRTYTGRQTLKRRKGGVVTEHGELR